MFWIINVILMLIASAFVLPSLLRKHHGVKDVRREQNIFVANEQLNDLELRFEQGEIDSDAYQSTRDEIEQSLFSDVNEIEADTQQETSRASILSTVLIVMLIPVIAIPVYFKLGNMAFTQELDSKQAAQNATRGQIPQNADGTPDIDTMISGLQKKMEENPENAKGWYMLGRSYMVIKRYPEAVTSYEKALALKPNSADIMLSLADSLAMTNNGVVFGRPSELIDRALVMQPNNLTGLWLGGMAARQEGNSLVAIERWTKALAQVSDPSERAEIKSLISEATGQLSESQKAQLATSSKARAIELKTEVKPKINVTSSNKEGITVSISLSEKMLERASPTDFVFVYAKAMSGPPMPLAAAKIQVKDLPTEIVLNDAMAMMPSLKISSFPEVIVGARVSKTGQPIPQNGDLFTEKKSIKLGMSVNLEINSIVSK